MTSVFVIVLSLAVVGHDIVRTWEARSHIIQQTRREAENLAWAGAYHAESAFRLVSTILAGLVERVEVDGIGPAQLERLRNLMAQRVADAPMLEDLVLTNANGLAIVDGRPATAPINLAYHEYFRRLSSSYELQPYIGLPVHSRLTRNWIIPVSQRINHADGSFAGIMIAMVEVSYFSDFYATFHVGKAGAASLRRDDNVMLVRQSRVTPNSSSSWDSGSPVHSLFPKATSGTMEFVSPVDGVVRIGCYRHVAGFPLMVAMALGKNEQLTAWRNAAIGHLLGAIFVSLLLGIFGFRLAAQAQRIAHADRAEAVTLAATKAARHLAKARDLAECANRAKSRFLAGMSHELRTPLNGILGYAQLLHIEGNLNVIQAERVQAMLGAGKHLLQMITRILDLSEIEAGHVQLDPVAVDVQSVAEACLDLVRPTAEAKGLVLSIVVMPETTQELIADPTRLRQVLLNLLGNAAKFTNQGGVVLRLKPSADGTRLRIEVVDTGPGIPSERRRRLFQEFERLDTAASHTVEGAGLGLALSMRLMGLMGGHLGYEDNPDGGSVFWLELPWRTPTASARPPASPSTTQDTQPSPLSMRVLNVLIADDVPMNRDIASAFLRAAGHRSTCVENGQEALTAVASTDFDVVLMDVRMPQMDGLEATRQIRALDQARGQVPIVALTAQAFTNQVEQCREAGMDSHLSKPFELESLLAAIVSAMQARQLADVGPRLRSTLPYKLADPEIPPDFQQASVLNRVALNHTTSFLAPEMVDYYMQTISELGKTVLLGLSKPGALTHRGGELAETAHTLAGSAGMFGFDQVVTSGRRLEQALQSGAADTPAIATGFRVAVEAMLREIPNH